MREYRWFQALWAICVLAAVVPIQAQESLQLNLEKGVALALERNEEVLQAGREREKAEEGRRVVKSELLPHVEASFNYDRNWLLPSFVFDSTKVKIGTDNNMVGRIGLRQALYGGGKIGAGLGYARLNLERTQQAERQIHQAVRAAVEAQFYELLLARELVEAGELALERARANLSQVEALKRAGRASEYDILRAQVQVSQLATDSLQAQNRRRLALMTLLDVVGLDLDQKVAVAGDFRLESGVEEQGLEVLLDMARQRRPELLQAQYRADMQQRLVTVEKAEGRPSLDLVANGQMQLQSDSFDLGSDDWQRSWNTGLQLTVPLFDGRETGALVAQARIEVEQAQLQLQRLHRQVSLEIRQAWLNLAETGQRVQNQAATVTQAERGLAIAEARYRAGQGTQLETLDAQLVLLQARTAYAQARLDRSLAVVALERAVGVLGEG
ncbi:MAG: hypothetical protein GKR89_12205 [Candidatus Latescibacteria bacterium]|nr:hypothetical protein [Candidatus Latescibacterota bacterium]